MCPKWGRCCGGWGEGAALAFYNYDRDDDRGGTINNLLQIFSTVSCFLLPFEFNQEFLKGSPVNYVMVSFFPPPTQFVLCFQVLYLAG